MRSSIDIPDKLHSALRRRAAAEGISMRSLVIDAIESQAPMTCPPIPGNGKPGPLAPDRENPYEVLFS